MYFWHRLVMGFVTGVVLLVLVGMFNMLQVLGVLLAVLVGPLLIHVLWTHPSHWQEWDYWLRWLIHGIFGWAGYDWVTPYLGLQPLARENVFAHAIVLGVAYLVVHMLCDLLESVNRPHSTDLMAHGA